MKSFIYFLLFFGLITSCNTSKNIESKAVSNHDVANDTISISNEELEYEVIIIEPGFSAWLISSAKPKDFYTQSFLENRNLQYVSSWNQRVLSPLKYDPNLYEMEIHYQQGVDYGYDVNYKLYNYFIYFEHKYKQQLTGFIPRN